jgi:hypothetical protein
MTFKKPEAGAVIDIAKYQQMKLTKTIITWDFNGRLLAFAELGGFILRLSLAVCPEPETRH